VNPGESDARLRALFDANAGDVLNYLARRVDPVEDAADVLSDALLVACRRVRSIPEGPEDARMWLFVTAKNALRNHQRGKHRRHQLAEKLADAIAQEISGLEVSHSVQTVRAAIASLKPDDAELVRLVHWDEFALVDAARMLAIPASTARGRMQRIRNQLRSVLEASSKSERDTA
jgi:RNA polymerase sigma factor (sigma-70 family)